MRRKVQIVVVGILRKTGQHNIIRGDRRQVCLRRERADIRQHGVVFLRDSVRRSNLNVDRLIVSVHRYDDVPHVGLRILRHSVKSIERRQRDQVVVGLAVELRYRSVVCAHRCQESIARRVTVDGISGVIGCTEDTQYVLLRRHGHEDTVESELAVVVQYRIGS